MTARPYWKGRKRKSLRELAELTEGRKENPQPDVTCPYVPHVIDLMILLRRRVAVSNVNELTSLFLNNLPASY
jgi:hypothetical protein